MYGIFEVLQIREVNILFDPEMFRHEQTDYVNDRTGRSFERKGFEDTESCYPPKRTRNDARQLRFPPNFAFKSLTGLEPCPHFRRKCTGPLISGNINRSLRSLKHFSRSHFKSYSTENQSRQPIIKIIHRFPIRFDPSNKNIG